ncbi:hypothetical protein BDM02DRAFT_3263899 [Thelephora ganbajun]|uniref:Uncharacterized protein n=1 Tax=Thelephora ganbajun TaxID=370292 RepID=A0ACB6Z2Q7_THEGA|nr:hypothetical protein BDM02DRAFT_3263899 [Thelephora ganbajun]
MFAEILLIPSGAQLLCKWQIQHGRRQRWWDRYRASIFSPTRSPRLFPRSPTRRGFRRHETRPVVDVEVMPGQRGSVVSVRQWGNGPSVTSGRRSIGTLYRGNPSWNVEVFDLIRGSECGSFSWSGALSHTQENGERTTGAWHGEIRARREGTKPGPCSSPPSKKKGQAPRSEFTPQPFGTGSESKFEHQL